MLIREIEEKDNKEVELLIRTCLIEFGANKFYKKHGFIQLDKPLIETEHYACDVWYIKRL